MRLYHVGANIEHQGAEARQLFGLALRRNARHRCHMGSEVPKMRTLHVGTDQVHLAPGPINVSHEIDHVS